MRIQTEIGLLPKDWKVVQILDVGSNYSYGVGAEAIMYDGKNKYLRITDIDDSSHRYSPAPIVSPSFFGDNHILKEDEIVVARTGASVGKSYIYNSQDGRLIYAGFLMKFKVSNEDSKYVFYHLTTKRYNTWVAMNSVRSGQPGLNLVQLKEFLLPLPPKPEQERIAAALTSIDSLIDNLERTIQKKKNIREGAMEELLSGKRRLPGFSGEWVEVKIGEMGKLSGAGVDKKSNPDEVPIRLVNYLDVYRRNRIANCELHHRVTASPDKVVNCNVRRGDIFFTPSSELPDDIGQSAVAVEDMENVCYSYHIYRLRPSMENYDPNYGAYAFQTKFFFDQVRVQSEGSGKRYVVSLTKFRELSVMLPPTIHEQHAIADTLTALDDEIALLQAERDKYQQIRSGMMDDLLTGKIRLV